MRCLTFPLVMYRSESWTMKEAEYWRIDFFELWCQRRLLKSSLDSPLEVKPVSSKGNQPWILIGKTDAGAEAPILWPPDGKSWLIGKDSEAGKDWGQEEKGMTEDEVVGWHHRLNGQEFEQTQGDGEGEGSLVCCSPWVTESDTNEQLKEKGSR